MADPDKKRRTSPDTYDSSTQKRSRSDLSPTASSSVPSPPSTPTVNKLAGLHFKKAPKATLLPDASPNDPTVTSPVQSFPVASVPEGRRRGKVVTYFPDKGYGFIVDDLPGALGPVRVHVHRSSVTGRDDQQIGLSSGQRVTYEIVQGQKGLSARNVLFTSTLDMNAIDPSTRFGFPRQNSSNRPPQTLRPSIVATLAAARAQYYAVTGQQPPTSMTPYPPPSPSTTGQRPYDRYARSTIQQSSPSQYSAAVSPVVDSYQHSYPPRVPIPIRPDTSPAPQLGGEDSASPYTPPQHSRHSLPDRPGSSYVPPSLKYQLEGTVPRVSDWVDSTTQALPYDDSYPSTRDTEHQYPPKRTSGRRDSVEVELEEGEVY